MSTDIQYSFKKLTVDDITDEYIFWLNNPVVNEFLEVRHKVQTIETVSDFLKSFYDQEEKYIWGIYHDIKMIGTVTLYDLNREEKNVEIGLMIGDTDYWGKLASDSAYKFALGFAFKELDMESATGCCYDDNLGIIFTFKKFGFVKGRAKFNSHESVHQWRISRKDWNYEYS